MSSQQQAIPRTPSQAGMSEVAGIFAVDNFIQQPATDSQSPRGSATFVQEGYLSENFRDSREFDSSDACFGPINNAFDMQARPSCTHNSVKKCPSSLLAQSRTLHDEEDADESANTTIMSPSSVEYVSNRLRKMDFQATEVVQIENETVELISTEELLPERAPQLCVELPCLELDDVKSPIRQFVNQVKNQHEADKRIIRLHTQDNPISQRTLKKQASQRTSSFSERIEAANLVSEAGKLIIRMQSVELHPAKSIPSSKPIENGHLLVFVSLGNQTFDVASNPIVCLDNSNPRALFDQVDAEFDAQVTKNDTLAIAVYFQDQDSLRGKKFKKFRSMVQNLVHRKKSGEGTLQSVPSTLSTLSTVSSRATGHNTEVQIGRTEIGIRNSRFSELFSGKILDMEVRFDENEWIKGLKITCCFVPNSDLVECGFPKRVPKNLIEGAEFIEYRNLMRSVNYECLLSVRKSTETAWRREICQFRGYRIFCFDKLGYVLKRVIDLRHLTFVSDASQEMTGMIPRHFRLYLNQADAAYVEFLASSQNDYKCCTEQLTLLQTTLASIRKPQNLQVN